MRNKKSRHEEWSELFKLHGPTKEYIFALADQRDPDWRKKFKASQEKKEVTHAQPSRNRKVSKSLGSKG